MTHRGEAMTETGHEVVYISYFTGIDDQPELDDQGDPKGAGYYWVGHDGGLRGPYHTEREAKADAKTDFETQPWAALAV